MSRDADWNAQQAFMAVLEEGSLSGAARRLGLTQPTVRARVAALEHALGAVLFTRSAGGMVPTARARALAGPIAAMARASEAFVRAASADAGEVAGTVRLGVSELVGVAVVPPMLGTLRERHPRLAIELALSNDSAALLEREVDVAVRMHRPSQDALVARRATAIPLGLYARRDYLERRGRPADVEALAEHDLIGPDRSARDLELAARLFPGVAPERFALRTDSHPAHLAAARAGLGIAVVQRPLGEADPDLARVLPELDVATLEVWIATHEDLRAEPRIRAVSDCLVEAFRRYAAGPPGLRGTTS